MRYTLPNLGTLTVSRKGGYTDGWGFGLRYKWDVSATDTDGNTFRSWVTTPEGMGEDGVFIIACEAISEEVARFTGDDTGNEWSLYASDVSYGTDYAACYAEHVSHYRIVPFAYDPGSQTFPTLGALERWVRDWFGCSLSLDTDVIDVYRNNDDEPSHRYTKGPRGGLRRENY